MVQFYFCLLINKKRNQKKEHKKKMEGKDLGSGQWYKRLFSSAYDAVGSRNATVSQTAGGQAAVDAAFADLAHLLDEPTEHGRDTCITCAPVPPAR